MRENFEYMRAAAVFSAALTAVTVLAGCPATNDLMSEFQPGTKLRDVIVGKWQARYVDESQPSGNTITFSGNGTVTGVFLANTFEVIGDDAILFRSATPPISESNAQLWRFFGRNTSGELLFVQFNTDQSTGPFVLTPANS